MVGGGFYALLGKISGLAGMYTPFALVITGLLAIIVSFAFAELSSRFPVSSGSARYIASGFNSPILSGAVGWLMICTGIVSAAALSVATIGFLQDFIVVPTGWSIFVLVLLMGGIAAWGIRQAVIVVAIITVIEVAALVYVMFAAQSRVTLIFDEWQTYIPSLSDASLVGIFSGAFLAFYAFIGFEDMVTIAEEVRNPRRTLPTAIIISVMLTVLLYIAVSIVAVTSVPLDVLASANTPVAAIVGARGWYATTGLGIVSILTGLNGALVQIIMASRMTYGLAASGHASTWFRQINKSTQTPMRATGLILSLVLLLALFTPLTTLAQLTSGIILVVFSLINVAWWRIKRKDPDKDGVGPRFPLWLPIAGASACCLILIFQLAQILSN